MAIPKRYERHVVACALCNTEKQFGDYADAQRWVQSHSRFNHQKRNSYLPDALRTITVIYETKTTSETQLPEHCDPTSKFLSTVVQLHYDDDL